jgi:hypothetical protein
MKSMTKVAVLTAVLACSVVSAASASWTCTSVRGNGQQQWTWTSDSREYSWHQVNRMCRNSGAVTCSISCVNNYSGTANVPAATVYGNPNYYCTVRGLHGHIWKAVDISLDSANAKAHNYCRTYGITPCTLVKCGRL